MAEGDYLRVGYLVDSDGRRIELRLPMLRTDTRRTRKAWRHQPENLNTVYALWRLDEQIAANVDNCKAGLTQQLALLPRYYATTKFNENPQSKIIVDNSNMT